MMFPSPVRPQRPRRMAASPQRAVTRRMPRRSAPMREPVPLRRRAGAAAPAPRSAAGGEGVQVHGRRTVEELPSSGGQSWLVLLVAGFPVVTVVEAGSAGVRSVGPARRTGAAAGRVRSCLQMHRRAAPGWGGAPIRSPGARPQAADERQGSQGQGRYGVGTIWAMPGRLVAPGPGRSTTAFTVPLPVAGMQKTTPSLAAGGAPSFRLPAAMPVSVMHCVVAWPKAPLLSWPAQKFPLPVPLMLVTLELPVVRGFSSTASAPLKSPPPNSGGQSWLVLLVAGFPVVELVEQAPPLLGPMVRPVAPLPLQGGVAQSR